MSPVKRKTHTIPELVNMARKQGWKVHQRKNSHYIFYPPEKSKGCVTVSLTPSDARAISNIHRDLRRAGLNV